MEQNACGSRKNRAHYLLEVVEPVAGFEAVQYAANYPLKVSRNSGRAALAERSICSTCSPTPIQAPTSLSQRSWIPNCPRSALAARRGDRRLRADPLQSQRISEKQIELMTTFAHKGIITSRRGRSGFFNDCVSELMTFSQQILSCLRKAYDEQTAYV